MGIICMISLCYSICMYVTGWKINSGLIFLTWVDSVFPVYPSLLFLIIDELGLGDKKNWESTKAKKFKP